MTDRAADYPVAREHHPVLRFAGVFASLAVPLWLGIAGRSPLVVPILALLFATSNAIGNWHRWQPLLAAGLRLKSAVRYAAAVAVQLMPAAVLYALGRMLGAWFDLGVADGLDRWDAKVLGSLAVLLLAVALFLRRSTR